MASAIAVVPQVATGASNTAPATFMDAVEGFVIPEQVQANDPWMHIDLVSRNLVLLRGQRRVEAIPYIAYGKGGYRRLRMRGSQQTPVGRFRIQRVNHQSKFRTFLEFDYPTPNAAWAANAMGLLSDRTYRGFQAYREKHDASPPDTRLGGHIGIHGLGSSPEWIHKRRDWTEGCIAVTNNEIDLIERWLDIGSTVVIRG
ncbi:L,D-transpeptidase [Halomonas sp. I5-271120]|uniref:L,D-transpeptidase n=1 Tax=Halomonas sp. I5-271120 TaxID=3061632 RepID=UPI00271490B0|nr:L,D-transpeptidase [Halomonas sp. I5-271120]